MILFKIYNDWRIYRIPTRNISIASDSQITQSKLHFHLKSFLLLHTKKCDIFNKMVKMKIQSNNVSQKEYKDVLIF